jgi:hypothetical protein
LIHLGPNARYAYTTLEFEEQWTVRGSELEEQIKHTIADWKRKNKDPWYQEFHVTMLIGKGKHVGADVFTREMLEESSKLFARFFDIRVTTRANKTYTTWDLCARGSKPDDPSSPFKMPCKIIDPHSCFREYSQYLDPAYAAYIDPVANTALPAFLYGLSYSNSSRRPSINDLTNAQIKEVLSQLSPVTGKRGCPWYTETTTWTTAMFSGGSEWSDDGKVLTKAKAMSWTMYVDGPRRIAFRMSLTKPELADEHEILEALDLHAKEWTKLVGEFSKTSKSLEAASLEAGYLDDLEQDLEEPDWQLIISCAVLMNLFVTLSMGSWTAPLQSRAGLGGLGIGAVVMGTIAAAGIYFHLGYRINSAVMGGMPFLAMGLGVNDMLVLTRSFSELGIKYIQENKNPTIIGEVLSRSGLGVTLSSLCNVFAFSMASTLPMKGLSDFCVCAAIDAFTNYFAMMTLFLCCLCAEARRVRTRGPDNTLCTGVCHVLILRKSDTCGSESFIEEPFLKLLRRRGAPFFASKPVGIVLSILAVFMTCAAVVPITRKTVGYRPETLAPETNPTNRALELMFEHFNFFGSQLVFRNLDVSTNQEEMLKLYSQVSETRFTIPSSLQPYLSMFYSYAAVLEAANFSKTFGMSSLFVPLSREDSSLKRYAPYGTVNETVFNELFESWRSMPLEDPTRALTPEGGSYVYADLVQANEFNYVGGQIQFSFFPFYIHGTNGDHDFIALIEEVTDIVHKSPLNGKAYVYNPIFTYWSSFLGIDLILYKVLSITLAAMFFSALLLLQSFVSAAIVAVVSMMIVWATYAICVTFLKFNSWIVFSLMAAAGLSIEFTAHIVSGFVLSSGSPEERLSSVMQDAFPAIIQGAVSTFVGNVPLAFSHIPFLRLYLFVPFTVVVIVGLAHSLILLPGILPLCARFVGAGEEVEDQTKKKCETPELPVILGSTGVTEKAQQSFEAGSRSVSV